MRVHRIRIRHIQAVAPHRYRLYGTACGAPFEAVVRLRSADGVIEADCLSISDPAIPAEKIELWCERHAWRLAEFEG